MPEIIIKNGHVALVDNEDYPHLSQYKWHLHPGGYATRHGLRIEGLRGKTIYMHREILGLNKGEACDHLNGNPLDNRRSNLKKATQAENMKNRASYSNRSGWRGVTYRKSGRYVKRWRARIKYNGVEYLLGHYATAREAALAVNDKVLKLFGPTYRFFNQVFNLRYTPKNNVVSVEE